MSAFTEYANYNFEHYDLMSILIQIYEKINTEI